MKLNDLIDQAKLNSGATSDSDLARKLHVSRQAVSTWRTGAKAPDAVTCDAIAKMTGIPLKNVLGIAGEARAISAKEKAVWHKLATAAVLVLTLGTAPIGDALASVSGGQPMHYAKWLKELARFLVGCFSPNVRKDCHARTALA